VSIDSRDYAPAGDATIFAVHGVGKASIATKITQEHDGTIALENFSSQPVMLNEVHKVK